MDTDGDNSGRLFFILRKGIRVIRFGSLILRPEVDIMRQDAVPEIGRGMVFC